MNRRETDPLMIALEKASGYHACAANRAQCDNEEAAYWFHVRQYSIFVVARKWRYKALHYR